MPLSHMVQVLHLAACVMLIAGPWLVLIFPTISPMPWPDSDTRRRSLKAAPLSLSIRFLELRQPALSFWIFWSPDFVSNGHKQV